MKIAMLGSGFIARFYADSLHAQRRRDVIHSVYSRNAEKAARFASDYVMSSDVITKLEPGLFQKVTGLTVRDFELLVSLGVFNSELMNDAVYKFKRYEDACLVYTGINKHKGEDVGLYDTVLSDKDYQMTFVNEPTEKYYLVIFVYLLN